jgi:hypothetical protein
VHIDDQTSALASGELQPGERLLWSGRPDSTRIFFFFSAGDVFLIPFSLVAHRSTGSGRGRLFDDCGRGEPPVVHRTECAGRSARDQ